MTARDFDQVDVRPTLIGEGVVSRNWRGSRVPAGGTRVIHAEFRKITVGTALLRISYIYEEIASGMVVRTEIHQYACV